MSQPAIFWDPAGIELDSIGSKSYLRSTDGDTPYVSMSIRMLSVDTPETHYPGNARPSRSDQALAELAEWMEQGLAPVDPGLANYLGPKLSTGSAGTLQGEQGKEAHEAFESLIAERLTKPSGRRRRVYMKTGDQPFDSYGRLLAYLAPDYTAAEREAMTPLQRASLNLAMVASGWAASFLVYPSLPKQEDLELYHTVARNAFEEGLGAWADPLCLAAYEFRMCVKLHRVTKELQQGRKLSGTERKRWIDRYCCDLTTRVLYPPEDYYKVKPFNRLFIWKRDVMDAVAKLNLTPAVPLAEADG